MYLGSDDSGKEEARPFLDGLQSYLQVIKHIPVLSKQEELDLYKDIRWLCAYPTESTYLHRLLKRQPTLTDMINLTPTRMGEYTQAHTRSKRAFNKMFTSNLRLVVSVTTKYQPNMGIRLDSLSPGRNAALSLLDLLQEGAFGLHRAIEKFDPSKGCKFSTYATQWIIQCVLRSVHEKGSTIRLPVHIKPTQAIVREYVWEHPEKTHIDLTEVAKKYNMPLSRVEAVYPYIDDVASLDVLVDTSTTPSTESPEEAVTVKLDYLLLHKKLESSLSKEEYDILCAVHGIGVDSPEPADKIAARLGVAPNYIKRKLKILYQKLQKNPYIMELYQSHLKGPL